MLTHDKTEKILICQEILVFLIQTAVFQDLKWRCFCFSDSGVLIPLSQFLARGGLTTEVSCTFLSLTRVGQIQSKDYLFTPSINLLTSLHGGHSAIKPVRLDSLIFQRLLVLISKD